MSLSQIDRIAEQNRIDNALLIKNDRMGRNARPRVNIVKKNLTGIDEELLKEYQQVKPNTYEFIDPQTGETKYRKYQLPDSMPELEPDVEAIPNKELETELERIEDIQKGYVREYESLKYKIDLKDDEIVELKNEINSGKKFSRNQSRAINNELRLRLLQLEGMKAELPRLEKAISDGDLIKQQTKDKFAEVNATSTRVKKTNLDRVNMYRDELNFLNKGSFSTAKADNESEMEYLERLQNNAQILSPEDELIDAKFMTVSRFREKMRELVKDPVLIEQVINTLDGNSDDNVDQKAELLKNWNLLKTKFIATYGVNNKRLKVSDVITFFDFFLQTGESGLSKAVEGSINVKNEPSGVTMNGVDVIPQSHDDTLLIVAHTAGGDKLIHLKSINDGSKLHLVYSFTGVVGSFKEFFDEVIPSDRKSFRQTSKSSTEIEKYSGITPQKFNDLFGITIKKVNPSMIAKKMFEKYGIRSIGLDDEMVKTKRYAIDKSSIKTEIEYGMGLENIPQYVEFGDVFILLKKLYYDNILSVRDRNMKSIAGLKTAKVSEPLVNIIMGMSKGLHPTYGDINVLSSPERQLYDRVIRIANLNKAVFNQGEKSVAELKKRLSLVEGQLDMGNDNYALQQEIHTILNSLHQLKAITKGQKDKYLKQFL